MAFISEFIGRPVVDIDGERVGSLVDMVARFQKDLSHPVIVGVVVKRPGGNQIIGYTEVAVMAPAAVSLGHPIKDIHTYTPNDQQIIDVDGARVVRANDLELIRVSNKLVVSNVDVGASGLLRRIGLEKPLQKMAALIGRPIPRNFISLDDVDLMPHDKSLRLRVPGAKVASLHPADLAEIISDLNRAESDHLLETLDVKLLADTLEEVEPEFQASLVSEMSDEKVADVLDEMSPDEAADLLAELPKERSEDLLDLMESDEADDVRKLLAFPEDSAGGIMTTDFAAVLPEMTTEQVMVYLRETMAETEPTFYVYVTGLDGVLVGVFSLSDLILASPGKQVAEFMHRRVVSVQQLDKQERVAQMIAKYNLLAVPVVDYQDVLQGIVTADDALDHIIPTAWKKRLPRMYR
jgi:magnesium transporter